MWLRDPLPIELSRVATVSIGLQFIDETTSLPFDITGFTMKTDVAITEGYGSVYSPETSIDNASEGSITVVFDGTNLANIAGKFSVVNLAYQVTASDTSGDKIIAVRGPLILVPGI